MRMTAFWARLRTAVLAALCAQIVFTGGLAFGQSDNYQGLWWNSPPGSESGWGINFAHQGDTIFATWFTYDAAGEAWWLSMTANKTADRTYAGTLIQTSGPPFSAVPFDPTRVTRTAVGTGTLTFLNADNGTFAYEVNGVPQSKAITRQVFGTLPTCTHGTGPKYVEATNYQDLWWVLAGAESGWGIDLAHEGDTIFGTWFTYDADGTPMWLSVTAPKVATSLYSGQLIRTSGPAFNAVPFDPAKVTRTVVGTATFTFAHGNAATFAYTVNGVSQVKTITRQLFDAPAGTVCGYGSFGELTFDKISVATFPQGVERVTVTAKDAGGTLLGWTAQSANPAIARVTAGGSEIAVTGVAYGSTQVTVVTATGVQRVLPVQVYNPKVLDAGDLLIGYVDQFACRWSDAHAGAVDHASFYHPINLGEWKALGSLGVHDARECPAVNGKQWMMVVQANPAARPATPALKPPVSFLKEWDDRGTGSAVALGAFWTPVCPDGYVAMGTVVTSGRAAPPVGDVTCVRRDLTMPAQATDEIWTDEGTGGDVLYQGSFAIQAKVPSRDIRTAYLTTGTFVTRGQLLSCQGEGCWQPPRAHDVMNVLQVDLPMLIDTPRAATIPQLTSFQCPSGQTEPLMAKAMLVPFTLIDNDGKTAWQHERGWMVNNSPFVRVERVVRWQLEFCQYNTSSVEQNPSKAFTKGIETTESQTMSTNAGISVTAEGGVKFLGTGGSVSATVSLDFGYASQESVSEFSQETTTITINVPAHKVAAAWQKQSEIVVKLHNPETHLLEPLDARVLMNDSLVDFITDDYPD